MILVQVVRCPQSTVHDFVVAKKLEIIFYVYTVACFEQIHMKMLLGRINVAREQMVFQCNFIHDVKKDNCPCHIM
jgi:hypothetical protein